ncbi:MAG TPA: imidazole glycerol phosphate synthase subunit HisH [Gemmatimonadales bacterium]|nr:imidazole glycerol phosphate synthase subunit HisH [Gemmatimonadales bacterium]
MIIVVDYGVNNLKSVVRALAAGGHTATLTTDPDAVRRAERVLVPGVGHYGRASRTLTSTGLGDAIRDVAARGQPVMGICLGLQLFFAQSAEAPEACGLGILPGRVVRFETSLPIPHVGWARVDPTPAAGRHGMLGAGFIGEPRFYYHVHSFHPEGLDDSHVLATGTYERVFPTLVGSGNVIGAQFHPEKSQRAGIELLDAFARWRP